MGMKISLECKLYRQTAGPRATWGTATAGVNEGAAAGSLDECAEVRNVTVDIEKSEANVSARFSKWKLVRGALREATIEIEMPYDPANTDYIAFRAAFLTDATIACAILDGDKATVGTTGLWADFEVMALSRDEQLEGEVMTNITLKPTYSAVAPEWVKVTS